MSDPEKKEDGGEKKEEDKKDDAAGDGEGGDGEGDDDQEFKGTGPTPVVSQEAFFRKEYEMQAAQSKIGSNNPKLVQPRVWQIKLWDVGITPKVEGLNMVFLKFSIGRNVREYLVKKKGRTEIWMSGEEGKEIYTKNILAADVDEESNLQGAEWNFEWCGAYKDLEYKSLSIEMWEASRWGVNKFDSAAELNMVDVANGQVENRVSLNKTDKFGHKVERGIVHFNILFEEMYNFSLLFHDWRLLNFLDASTALERINASDWSGEKSRARFIHARQYLNERAFLRGERGSAKSRQIVRQIRDKRYQTEGTAELKDVIETAFELQDLEEKEMSAKIEKAKKVRNACFMRKENLDTP